MSRANGEAQKEPSLARWMTDHFGTDIPGLMTRPDCLPFPAGPLLPRESTHSPPLIAHGLQPGDRIALAFKLWPYDVGGQHQDKSDYLGTLSRLHLLSASDWCSLHGKVFRPTTAVVDAWKALHDRNDPDEHVRDFQLRRANTHERMVERLNDQLLDRGVERLEEAPRPYQASHEETRAVQSYIDKLGLDNLLNRFWLKQFHAHFEHRWEESQSSAPLHKDHRAALCLLRLLPNTLTTATGSLTLRNLAPSHRERLAQWARRLSCDERELRSDDARALAWSDGQRHSHQLPACFCAHLAELAQQWQQHRVAETEGQKPAAFEWPSAKVSLDQAIAVWDAMKRPAEELNDVDALAREVAAQMQGQGVPHVAFAAPRYACDCHPLGPQTLGYSPPVGISESARKAVAIAAMTEHGRWLLMQRFFFKQLQNHHGYTWTSRTAKSDVHLYYRAAFDLLHRLSRDSSHPQLRAVARALTTPALKPPSDAESREKWFSRLLSSTQIGHDPRVNANGKTSYPSLKDGLPDEFCPGSLGDPERGVSMLILLSREIQLVPESIKQVDMLAREVASLMTDPWLCASLGWVGAQPHPEAAQRPFQAVVKLCQSYSNRLRPSERPSLLDAIDPHSDTPGVLDRCRALHKYFHVLSNKLERWQLFTQTAPRKTLPPTHPLFRLMP